MFQTPFPPTQIRELIHSPFGEVKRRRSRACISGVLKSAKPPPLAQEAALCYNMPKPIPWAIQEKVSGLLEPRLGNPFSIHYYTPYWAKPQ